MQSKSSKLWLQRQKKDLYSRKAHVEGFRARSAYKIIEIQERDALIRPGMRVVELGAAPGGWTQCLAGWVGSQGRVIALDRLAMDPIPGVECIQGDFTQEVVLSDLMVRLAGRQVDVVLSDMAPNLSGLRDVDDAQAWHLVECALAFAEQTLRPGGHFLVKCFQSSEFTPFVTQLRRQFAQVVVRKPKASRAPSRELYLLCRVYQGRHPAEGPGPVPVST